jgi:hypothetical protein
MFLGTATQPHDPCGLAGRGAEYAGRTYWQAGRCGVDSLVSGVIITSTTMNHIFLTPSS